jgi:NADH:ubiquinone oxidoreductase subunit
MEEEKLTIRQAFQATQNFLSEYYRMTNSDDIGLLLSILTVQDDDVTSDPAGWHDWMRSVQKVLFPDTPENHRLLEELVANQQNHLGKDSWGNDWYARLLPDGRQLWACVRRGEVLYGGIRNTPKSFNSRTGLSSPSSP